MRREFAAFPQWRQRLAGLRTNTSAALGAASFEVFRGGRRPGRRRLDSGYSEDSDRIEALTEQRPLLTGKEGR